jgi:hypothetical protein
MRWISFRCLALVLVVALPTWALAQAVSPSPAPEQDEAPAEGATEREISAELDRSRDAAVAERLRATFAGIDDLKGVSVAVEAGVVHLSGEVPTPSARQLAGQLARQVEDVALTHAKALRHAALQAIDHPRDVELIEAVYGDCLASLCAPRVEAQAAAGAPG